jgi:O-antigen/teichoic acid export membrane protein
LAYGLAGFAQIAGGLSLASMFGVAGAVVGYAAGPVAFAVIVRIGRRSVAEVEAGARPLRLEAREVVMAIAAFGGLWALTGADVFVSRHLLGPVESGLYVAASTAASTALFLPSAAATAVFPRLAADASGAGGRKFFFRSLAVVGALTIVTVGSLVVVRGQLIAVFFGRSYKGAAAILALLALSNGAQGLIGFLQLHQLAHRRLGSLLPWLGLVALVAMAETRHQDAHQIALEAVLASAGVLVVMVPMSIRMTGGPTGTGGGMLAPARPWTAAKGAR